MTGLVHDARAFGIAGDRRGILTRLAVSALAVGVVTGLVALLREYVPPLGLGVLYVLAILPVAVRYGRVYATLTAVASMLTLNFLFLPPTLSFTLSGEENWLVLVVYLITGLLVANLAGKARQRTSDAQQREREASLLADVSSVLLSGVEVSTALPGIAADAQRILNVRGARIELGERSRPFSDEVAVPLEGVEQPVGTLYVPRELAANLRGHERVLVALASVIGIALERERLAHETLETETLRRSDVLKTALLRTVSHDLRSPLTAIRVSLEALESPDLALDESSRAALLQAALAETSRLDRTLRNLLDLSRLQAGATPESRVSALEGLLDQAMAHFPAARARFDLNLPAELPPVRVDPVQLEYALVNLLENALKFSPPNAPVSIAAESVDGEVVIRIVDQGPGLAADELEPIFEPFRRASAGREGEGTGLGLAIARGFVETNGGRVWAEPTRAVGACFLVALPASLQPMWVEA